MAGRARGEITQRDQGRPLSDISTTPGHAMLTEDVHGALVAGELLERRVASRDRAVHYLMRILPTTPATATWPVPRSPASTSRRRCSTDGQRAD
jgi:hypothetical protein